MPDIGIIGLGRFGFMAYRYLRERVALCVFDKDPSRIAELPESAPFADTVRAGTILLTVPISEIAQVCADMAPFLKAGQVVIDTCSVKARPVDWMRKQLPDYVEIVGTHPLFGPDSGKEGIAGLKIAVCPVRVSEERFDRICTFLSNLELVVIETTPEEHDRQIAQSQAIFHLIAQALKRLDWGAKPLSTPGPDTFFRLVKTVQRDTEQLFHDMERENPFAAQYRRQFIAEVSALDGELNRRSLSPRDKKN